MAFAKFQENRFRIDGEIAENHAILVNLTASIDDLTLEALKYFCINHGDQRVLLNLKMS